MAKFNKRVLALILAMQMLISLALPIYAEGEEETETAAEEIINEPSDINTDAEEIAKEEYTYAIAGLGEVKDAYTEALGMAAKYYRYSLETGGVKQEAFVITADISRGAILRGERLGENIGVRGKVSEFVHGADEQKRLIAGVNADFFSTSTGLPMGIFVEDGRFVSSSEDRFAIAIKPDGSMFLGKADDKITMLFGEKELSVSYLNKYPDVYGVYLLNADFGKTTRVASTLAATEYIISVNGDLAFGGEVYGTVIEVRSGIANGEIPEGCAVLVVPDLYAYSSEYKGIEIGTEISFFATANEEFSGAVSVIGGGDVILRDGEPTDHITDEEIEIYRNPRTAMGITEEGNILLITVDGRRSNYSSGVKMTELADAMKALGCTDAINLDGGGSSTMVRFIGGTEVKNKPSDGVERKVPNALMLYEDKELCGNLHTLEMGIYEELLLCGSRLPIALCLYDASGEITEFEFNEENTFFEVDSAFGSVDFEDGVPYFTAGGFDGIGKISVSVMLDSETVSADAFLKITSTIDTLSVDQSIILSENDGREVLSVSALSGGKEVYFGDLLEICTDSESFIIVLDGRKVHVSQLEPFDILLDGEQNGEELYFDGEAEPLESVHGFVSLSLLDKGVTVPAYFDSELSLELKEFVENSLSVSNEGYTVKYDSEMYLNGDGAFVVESPVIEIIEEPEVIEETEIAEETEESEVPEETEEAEETEEIFDSEIPLEENQLPVMFEEEEAEEEAPKEIFEPFTVEVCINPDSLLSSGFDGRKIWMWVDGISADSRPYAKFSVDGELKKLYYDCYYDFLGYNGSALLTLDINIGEGNAYFDTLLGYTAFEEEQRVSFSAPVMADSLDTNLYVDTAEHWSSYYVNSLSYMGIVSGSENLKGELVYIPDGGLSREQFAKILVNYLSISTEEYSEYPLDFADVDSIAAWAVPYVKAAVGAGLMKGRSTPQDTVVFAPSDGIKRQEAIYVLGGLLGDVERAPLEFTDSEYVAPWAAENLEKALAAGLIGGYDDGSIRPDGGITRAEAATLVVKLYNFSQKAEKDLASEVD